MAEVDEDHKCPPPGLPAYMGTFADLMSLLMCFFVLLLAFSEMDVMKFKQIAGSMKYAFGVQNQIEVKDIPKGTSVIAQEFRPGRPDPTPIENIQQQTVEVTQQTLEFQAGDEDSAGGRLKQRGDARGGAADSTSTDATPATPSEAEAANQEQLEELMKRLAEQLEEQIEDGALELEALGQQITIRVREKGSFPSGSAFLQPQFKPIIQNIAKLLNEVPGVITVSGHTDNQRISSELYRSNWDLSAQRAVAVAHEMVKVSGFDEHRLAVEGRADTQPLEPNKTVDSRRRNRRVEISIMQGKSMQSDEIGVAE
ncbi:flagellar motor protein MotB [Corallincola luteus]|uniref:Flagellar motor protein MotB n=2 Tax=Corallincola TaxID=1775176 RepID=A0A368N3V2_9GAMM|nr:MULTISPECIES: flagellar motor protein MotB [Corallincola]RCU45247.1 flagellar motor protein MotB [Corallincola holothuriorum]TCI02888.1 flagellar motor protein MotB [Corallincola luteus]